MYFLLDWPVIPYLHSKPTWLEMVLLLLLPLLYFVVQHSTSSPHGHFGVCKIDTLNIVEMTWRVYAFWVSDFKPNWRNACFRAIYHLFFSFTRCFGYRRSWSHLRNQIPSIFLMMMMKMGSVFCIAVHQYTHTQISAQNISSQAWKLLWLIDSIE